MQNHLNRTGAHLPNRDSNRSAPIGAHLQVCTWVRTCFITNQSRAFFASQSESVVFEVRTWCAPVFSIKAADFSAELIVKISLTCAAVFSAELYLRFYLRTSCVLLANYWVKLIVVPYQRSVYQRDSS